MQRRAEIREVVVVHGRLVPLTDFRELDRFVKPDLGLGGFDLECGIPGASVRAVEPRTERVRMAECGVDDGSKRDVEHELVRPDPRRPAGFGKQAIVRRSLPLDFETKLMRLAQGDLTHRFVERSCRLFAVLLLAVQDEMFGASKADCERLLRVLAYVRKDDDLVADYKPDGFLDDQHEVRAAMTDLGALLRSFKLWRLEHQVPGMWADAA